MKQKTRNTIRKWTGLMLSLCILGLMLPIGVFAEQTNGTAFTYTGGVEDSTYTGDNALGDLVLPDPIELEDGKTEYAALVVDFPDQEGGGDVTMKTGNLTSNAGPVNKTVGYDDPEYPYPVEWGFGEQEITYESHGLTVKMDDKSTLDLDTGNITNTAGDAAKIVVTDLSKLELKTGTVEATEDGAEIQTSEGADIKIDFGTINVDGNGINLQSNDSNREKAPCKTEIQTESITSGGTGIQAESNNSDAKITVDGDINSGSEGLSLKIQYGGTAEVTVNGDIQNSGYSGVGISAENDVTVNVKTGNISGEGGVNLRNAAGTGDRSEVTIETGAIDVKNYGLDITTYTSTTNATVNGSVSSCGNALNVFNDLDADTNVTVHGDVTSEDGRGIDLTTGIVRSPEEDYDNSNTKIIVDGDVYGGSMGAYLMNNCGTLDVNIKGDITADEDYGIFFETEEESSSTLKAGNITSHGGWTAAAIESEGEGSVVKADIGDVDAYGTGIYASAWKEGSSTEVKAGKVSSSTDIAVSLDIEGTMDAKVGELNGYYDGLYVNVKDGTGKAETGKITSERLNGVDVSLQGGNRENGADITVNGDITAGGAGVQVSSSERWDYLTDEFGEYIEDDDGYPIEVRENSENYANVDVKGDIEAAEYGVKIWNHGGDFNVNVEGDVTTAGEQPNPDEWDKEIYGINVVNYADNTTINVQGDLNVGEKPESQSGENPVESETDGSTEENPGRLYGNGIEVSNYDGRVDITVEGDVNADNGTGIRLNDAPPWIEGNNGDAMITVGGSVTAENGIDVDQNGEGAGHVVLNVNGDLVSTEYGIKLGQETDPYAMDNPEEEQGNEENPDETSEQDSENQADTENETETKEPAVDIIVQETISGKKPILVANVEAVKNFVITTWAIRPNEDNHITEDEEGNAVQEVEENINYIIKKEDNENYGTLNVEGTTEKVLGESEDGGKKDRAAEPSDNEKLNVAKQYKDLTLSVDLKDEYKTGYDVVIYNGKGENKLKAEVTKKDDGTFIFTVPWAGGVYLSFDLEKLEERDPDPNPDPDPDPDPEKDPDPVPDPDPNPDPDPEPAPAPAPAPAPEPDPESDPEPDPEPAPEPNPEPERKKGSGRVLAIIYGEDESYTIWFTSGYRYHALFKDNYQEYGSYRIQDDKLVLKNDRGAERIIDEAWGMKFKEELTAEIVKADFSDSVKIIGEFNLNNEGILEITDNEMQALKISSISSYIDNPYALEILKAILPDEAE